ncbi:MAG: hypothetical protein JWN94_4713 [Betaproteobacteria bacterium]|nr:hypothetical protein [Betaproteobacteria bacterium]
MKRTGRNGQRLIAVFLLGCLLLNYPLLALFNIEYRLLGIPVLYVYTFVAWAVLIALTAAIVERDPD